MFNDTKAPIGLNSVHMLIVVTTVSRWTIALSQVVRFTAAVLGISHNDALLFSSHLPVVIITSYRHSRPLLQDSYMGGRPPMADILS